MKLSLGRQAKLNAETNSFRNGSDAKLKILQELILHFLRVAVCFYYLAKVLAICDGVPRKVGDVHFRSHLSRTVSLSDTDLRTMSETALQLLLR